MIQTMHFSFWTEFLVDAKILCGWENTILGTDFGQDLPVGVSGG